MLIEMYMNYLSVAAFFLALKRVIFGEIRLWLTGTFFLLLW